MEFKLKAVRLVKGGQAVLVTLTIAWAVTPEAHRHWFPNEFPGRNPVRDATGIYFSCQGQVQMSYCQPNRNVAFLLS